MKICLLGASGSIGQQTLDMMEKNPSDFSLVSFSVGNRFKCIPGILKRHKEVTHVALISDKKAKYYAKKYPNITFISLEKDKDGLNKIIKESNNEMVVNALVGFAGLVPSYTALKENKILALANKESLVVGGELINKLLKEGHGKLYPIDSEHSALWKCLKVDDKHVEKLVLTASGGSFRNLSREELVNVAPEDALKHPTWSMGAKITIDSATMMNKCFELIEAYHLFGYKMDKLDVVLHDESYLHSFVMYKDEVKRGEINKPDMRNPIKFALYQGNIDFETQTFNSLEDLKKLHFHNFDEKRFPLVKRLAELVINKGGNIGAIINASNEVAVNAFLNHEISFLQIEEVILKCVENCPYHKVKTIDKLVEFDRKYRLFAREYIEKLKEGNK